MTRDTSGSLPPQDGPDPSPPPGGDSPDAASDATVDDVFARFVAAREAGEAPDVGAAIARLPDEASREALRGLVKDLEETEAQVDGPVRTGERLAGRFVIGQELGGGQGGMGKVFAAFDENLQRHVAIKVLRDHTGGPLDDEGSLREEAVALAQLQHPNIVAIHEIVHEPDATFLIMDLVQGVALNDLLSRVKRATEARSERPRRAELLAEALELPVPEGRTSPAVEGRWFDAVARIVLEVTRCLEAAHGAGVLHRDLKPRNVMLRGDGSPVVLDFGLAYARTSGKSEPRGRLQGSAAYLAPEQIEAETLGNDPRTDVYQLGLLLYEMLTLQPAYTGKGLSVLLRHITRGEFTRPRALDRGIPFELEAICLRAIERDPDRRYASAAEMSADLQLWVDGSGLPRAARGGRLASALRQTRYAFRRRRIAVTTVLALLLGVAGSAFLMREPAPEHIRWFASEKGTAGEIDIEWNPVSVGLNDIIGFEIECAEPRVVYALSAFGEKDPPTWLAPMPLTLANSGPKKPAAAWDWGLQLSPGVHSIQCTQVTTLNKDIPFEGLWIFVSEQREPDLEQWMAELNRRKSAGGSGGVLFEHARSAFEFILRPAVTRGGSVERQSTDSRELAQRLEAAAVMKDADWPYESTRRYDRFMQVER